MNDLARYFENNNKNQIHKWSNYFDIYDRHFAKYRHKEIVIVEIGVSQGGSLQMWQDYFGPQAKIYGIDVDPRCKMFEGGNIKIFIGSQNDREFLRSVIKQIPPIDILIDDGSHNSSHQIVSFEELFDSVRSDGIYLCEDTHTSYWLKYGGGHKRRSTFIEYMKNIIDDLHAFHSKQWSLRPNKYTGSIWSVSFYDSIVVVEKGKQEAPQSLKSGHVVLPERPARFSPRIKKLRFAVLYAINYALRAMRLPAFLWK